MLHSAFFPQDVCAHYEVYWKTKLPIVFLQSRLLNYFLHLFWERKSYVIVPQCLCTGKCWSWKQGKRNSVTTFTRFHSKIPDSNAELGKLNSDFNLETWVANLTPIEKNMLLSTLMKQAESNRTLKCYYINKFSLKFW